MNIVVKCDLAPDADLRAWNGMVALDSLLAATVARRDNLEPARTPEDVVPIDIPIDRDRSNRFHLASHLIGAVEIRATRWTQRRFPVQQALHQSDMRSVHLGSGAQKNFRIPAEVVRVVEDRLVAFAVGNPDAVRDLLALVTHVGARRGVGYGRVLRWTVEECETWPGFPVVDLDGSPLRPLPPSHPAVRSDAARTIGRLTYPYWSPLETEEIVAP